MGIGEVKAKNKKKIQDRCESWRIVRVLRESVLHYGGVQRETDSE